MKNQLENLSETFQKNDLKSSTPKYQQIVDHIISAIQKKQLTRGAQLPSINLVSKNFSVARETVVKAYKELKSRGIIESRPGKGFYVNSESIEQEMKVFLFFDEFVFYKQQLYQSFKDTLPKSAFVDVFFHHHNFDVFEKLLLDSLGKYSHYVIMALHDKRVVNVLKRIEPNKLLLLDRADCCENKFASVCQDFNDSVFECLEHGLEVIKKYQKIVLVLPQQSIHPAETARGVKRFCQKYSIDYEKIHPIEPEDIQQGVAYLVIFDNDLVDILEMSKLLGFEIGEDLGIISYNDTPLKHFIDGGLTVISTNFELMGRRAAEQLLKRQPGNDIIPTKMIVRNSL
ncbi:GntR family transcriptional regulator [candidate division KSB1 bacterium]|nr:GntR family transcriptional regulator [candidate division KSB1 bacterium]